MQWFIDFFSSLFSALGGVLSMVVSAVKGLIDIIASIPQLLDTATQAITSLPSIIQTFIFATITVSVIYLVIGRGEGGD